MKIGNSHHIERRKTMIINILLIALVYIAGIIGVFVMKKIQPEDKIYPIWVVCVCVLFTFCLLSRLF